MAISWNNVQTESLYQEIATALRPRNDSGDPEPVPVYSQLQLPEKYDILVENKGNEGISMKRILALLLCAVLLAGCVPSSVLERYGITHFRDMDYVRPDMDAIEGVCDEAIALAASSGDADEVLDALWSYYDAYDNFNTSYDLAYIHHHADLTDEFWQMEHDFCAEHYSRIDMLLEELYTALAESPLRSELEEQYFGEGFLLDYLGEPFYDEELLSLYAREQELISEFYAIGAECEAESETEQWYDECALPMAELLAELTALRNQIAARAGYDSYTDYAWDFSYYRDYTAGQAKAYIEDIRRELVPLYENMNSMDVWTAADEGCTESEVRRYVRTAAREMGGIVREAFTVMELAELYDISASPRKSGMSFELFLDWYCEPYLLVSGTGTRYDCLTVAHEFGHFAMDYAAGGSWAGTDVLEVFSQGMEYLSLCYGGAEGDFIRMKLADSLSTYVEQAAYAAFELQLYELPGEELTGEGVLALYEEVCAGYGFRSADWEPRDMVTVPHFYEMPHYVISYVVSNDAAMQLFEMELKAPGTGAACFEQHLTTESEGFLEFIKEAELKSPFGRIDEVKGIMEGYFGS